MDYDNRPTAASYSMSPQSSSGMSDEAKHRAAFGRSGQHERWWSRLFARLRDAVRRG